MWFLQNGLPVAVVITGSFLVSASAIAKALPPNEGCRPVSKIEYNAAKREYLLTSRVHPNRPLLATPLLALPYLMRGGGQMGQWLIADVSFLDVHVQLWMVLVVMVVLLWFFYVWATRKP